MSANTAKKIEQNSAANYIWFVARGSVMKGPFTTDQLQDRIKKKEINHRDFCWRQGFREWRPISSVEDFDRRERIYRLPTYPTVEVPSGSVEPDLPSAAKLAMIKRGTAPKQRQVSFAVRGGRRPISIYEWALMVIFSVGFAFLATHFALNEVQQRFNEKLRLHFLGSYDSLGDSQKGVHPSFWAPVFSAPEADVFFESNKDPISGKRFGQMPVDFSGVPRKTSQGYYQIEKYQIDANHPVVLFDAETEGLDVVYTKPVNVHGVVAPKDAYKVNSISQGEPLIDR